MTLLMTAGEFDLSVGAVFGFCPVLMWTLYNSDVTSLDVAFVVALAAAACVGLLNGICVTWLWIPSFLVTLGTLLVVRGTALYITDGFPQRTWEAGGHWLPNVLVGDFEIGGLRVYMSFFWFIGFAAVFHYVLTQTKVGNWIQASGGNPNAARARGVNVARTKVCLFILTAVMAGFAGIISSIRTSAANPNSGTGYELEVIAMVVIGGTALRGGRGTIIGTVIGVLILRVDAQRHRAHRRAGAGLQHLHRHDPPRDDGASLGARAQKSGKRIGSVRALGTDPYARICKSYGSVQALAMRH